MAAAAGAGNLGALHAEAAVAAKLDVRLRNRRPEAGPAGARLEFRVGAEELEPACRADICPLLMIVPVRACERRLGPLVAEHVVLLGGKRLPPLLVALRDLPHRQRIGSRCRPGGAFRADCAAAGR